MSERVMESRAPLPARKVPPLENGDHLSATEFLHRYEAMPEVKKAELIQGIVTMGSPVRFDVHGEPDSLIQSWLVHYRTRHLDCRTGGNTTLRLGPDDVLQPDAVLWRDAAQGGRASLDGDGYLVGSPEMVVEIAASSVSKDAREKLVTYRRASIGEYLLWRVEDAEIDWFFLDDDEYRKGEPNDGILRSRTFPGLWLDVEAALANDPATVLETLDRGMTGESE